MLRGLPGWLLGPAGTGSATEPGGSMGAAWSSGMVV